MEISELRRQIGAEVGVSHWIEITQDRIDKFADATGDRQWIHVDPERASRESSYKTTIAHGFLTLALLSQMAGQVIPMQGISMAVNYGLNRVRFTAPVPPGSRIRGHFTLGEMEDIPGGVQTVWNVVVELEGSEKPRCVAEWVVRYYL